jgi:hypothetical protein
MSVASAFQYFTIGVIVLIVMFSIMVVIVPMLGEVADASSMLMVGLIGFTLSASVLYKGFKELFISEQTKGHY